MCLNGSQWYQSTSITHHPPACCRLTKRCKVRVRRLTSRRRRSSSVEEAAAAGMMGMEMAMKNLKLYMENRSIMQENEKLREKALLLRQENRALMFELFTRNSFSHIYPRHEKSFHVEA